MQAMHVEIIGQRQNKKQTQLQHIQCKTNAQRVILLGLVKLGRSFGRGRYKNQSTIINPALILVRKDFLSD